ncbi:hypothetical protein F503_02162 [Ophiostoma piceae UAMH 11346]|uniref:Uncharacterized protein n=1 Tax=Ophiostoma piceae (strain UAMH 11346) TaxID=1262450 RepID=S3CGK5_OPHP1|nr:hypothetical protein F503_02162 [Ophiostoma piceae UAMH 11346]
MRLDGRASGVVICVLISDGARRAGMAATAAHVFGPSLSGSTQGPRRGVESCTLFRGGGRARVAFRNINYSRKQQISVDTTALRVSPAFGDFVGEPLAQHITVTLLGLNRALNVSKMDTMDRLHGIEIPRCFLSVEQGRTKEEPEESPEQ